MDDKQIVDLFWNRSEEAIKETSKKYGRYCQYIAYRILNNKEDAEECVNDTYLRTWNSIPPQRPTMLATYLGKITRNLALNKWEYYDAKKRGSGQAAVILEELQECIPAIDNTANIVEEMYLTETFNKFLAALPAEKRKIFMRRYWYMSSIKEIARDFCMSESKIKMSLLRIRKEFREFLEKEGICL